MENQMENPIEQPTLELLAMRIKSLKEILAKHIADNATLNLRIMKQDGIIQHNTKEIGELKELIVKQAKIIELYEIREIERSWEC